MVIPPSDLVAAKQQAADAAFLQQQQASSALAPSSSSPSEQHQKQQLALLAKTNRLHLQVQELISTTTSPFKKTRSWYKYAETYQTNLIHRLQTMELPQQQLPPLLSTDGGKQPKQQPRSPPVSSISSSSSMRLHVSVIRPLFSAGTTSSSSMLNFTSLWSSDDVSGIHDTMDPHNNKTLPPLPTLSLRVHIPNTCWESNDYRKSRYFMKRNSIVQSVASKLSSMKSKVGTVYVGYWKADPRKQYLMIVPPPPPSKNNTTTQAQSNKKARKVGAKSKDMASSETTTTAQQQQSRVRFRVQLIFTMESLDWIPPLRLVPDRTNLGAITTATNNATTTVVVEEKNSGMLGGMHHIGGGSIHYNHSLTEDALHLFSDNYDAPGNTDLQHPTTSSNVYSEAAVLLYMWCYQRGLWYRHDGPDEYIIEIFLLYLVRTKRINTRMTPLQIVTAFLKLLADTIWLPPRSDSTSAAPPPMSDKSGSSSRKVVVQQRSILVMPTEIGQSVTQTLSESDLGQLYTTTTKESMSSSKTTSTQPLSLIELYRSVVTETPVLLDSSLRHNYLFRISAACIAAMQQNARQSLQCLHGGDSTAVVASPFHHLFTSTARFWSRHDAYVRIALSDLKWDKTIGDTTQHQHRRTDLGDYEYMSRRLIQVLSQALGDRVTDIQLLSTGNCRVGATNQHTAAASSNSTTRSSVWMDAMDIPFWLPNDIPTKVQTPTGLSYIYVGVNVNSDTCFRVVDRGPPPEDTIALQHFLDLWGSKAELRRFKDGAIVHAVVWDTTKSGLNETSYTQYQNDDAWQGGIVERIMQHILQRHFLKPKATIPQFSLRDIVSTVDGVVLPAGMPDGPSRLLVNPLAGHRSAMKAMEAFTDWLRKKSALTTPTPGSTTAPWQSALGLPLAISSVEPLSPALRYVALYPPVPHPTLGASASTVTAGSQKVSGAVLSDPIEVQIRFGLSSKWPTDIKAIGAAKTAMLIQLVNGIERLKKNGSDSEFLDGPMIVTTSYADIPFLGYVFRVFVRCDPEIKVLQSILKPTGEETLLLQKLTQSTVIAPRHHALVHGVYTSHPASSATVRLAYRLLSTHMLAGQIPFEALELMVVHVFTDRSSAMMPPGTVLAGFLRWLHLLSTFDWARQPLIVDPQGHLNDSDYDSCVSQFEKVRGPSYRQGPFMYIVSPSSHSLIETNEDDAAVSGTSDKRHNAQSEKMWSPTYTEGYPELVVLSRAVALAKRTYTYLHRALMGFERNAWPAAFHESAESYKSYSALLRIDPAFVYNPDASSNAPSHSLLVRENKKSGAMESTFTRSMTSLVNGPKQLQRKLYRNLMSDGDGDDGILLEWRPIQAMVQALHERLGGYVLVFYNDLCPDVIGVVWRKPLFQPRPFSAMTSEYSRPVSEVWQSDTLVTLNVEDVLREIDGITRDVVTDVKVFDHGPTIDPGRGPTALSTRGKRKSMDDKGGEKESDDDDDSSNSDSSNE